MTTTDLPSLLTRVQAATGPDRELGLSILNAAFGEAYLVEIAKAPTGDKRRRDPTSSVDAALALVEKLLPGAQATIFVGPEECEVGVWTDFMNQELPGGFRNRADKCLPLAILAALLSAFIQKEKP